MMTLWWMSFCDPEAPRGTQFLGVSIVAASDIIEATMEAHRLKCNPGGEIAGIGLPEEFTTAIGSEWRNRLLTKTEIAELNRLIAIQLND